MKRRKKFQIMNEEEMLTFVSCFLAKLSDSERDSVIKYGGECYRDGYIDGGKVALKASIVGIVLGLISIGVIERKIEAKEKTKIYSFEEIKEDLVKKGEEING